MFSSEAILDFQKHNQTRWIARFGGCDEMGSQAGIFFHIGPALGLRQ
jgi:hypothetical protein